MSSLLSLKLIENRIFDFRYSYATEMTYREIIQYMVYGVRKHSLLHHRPHHRQPATLEDLMVHARYNKSHLFILCLTLSYFFSPTIGFWSLFRTSNALINILILKRLSLRLM